MRAVVGPCPWSPDTPCSGWFEKGKEKKENITQIICILHTPPAYENKYDVKVKERETKKKNILITDIIAYQTSVVTHQMRRHIQLRTNILNVCVCIHLFIYIRAYTYACMLVRIYAYHIRACACAHAWHFRYNSYTHIIRRSYCCTPIRKHTHTHTHINRIQF